MKNFLFVLLGGLFWVACNTANLDQAQKSNFKLVQTTHLDSIAPIGLAFYNDQLWLSDGDNNRLVALKKDGSIDKLVPNFDRPMHLESDKEYLYVPEYGLDSIRLFSISNSLAYLPIGLPLDAPSGISVQNKQIALADFYNHRIVYSDAKQQWKTLGKKGKEAGNFHYPTDVQWTKEALYVADAYNHRVQVFDREGNFLRTIGEADALNAATGLHVSGQRVAVTDFENNRVLIYTTAGKRLQILTEELDKPTDVLFWKGDLYVINYGSKTLQRYTAP